MRGGSRRCPLTSPALIIVDLQKDFCPGGSLAVAEGDRVVPVINRALSYFSSKGFLVIASRDWHPEKTRHFRSCGGPWPLHCVQGTPGGDFHAELQLPTSALVVSKGMDPDKDAYSAFDGVDSDGESLDARLRRFGVTELWVTGLATDYCVRATVLEARQRGYGVTVIADACRAVDLSPDDGEDAIREMAAAGARVLSLDQALEQIF